jgi:hypothetical protein
MEKGLSFSRRLNLTVCGTWEICVDMSHNCRDMIFMELKAVMENQFLAFLGLFLE